MSEKDFSSVGGNSSPKDAKARAKAEKAYRKAQRPFYKKKRYILPGALVVLIAAIVATTSGGSKKSSDSKASGNSKACTAAYPDKQGTDVCSDAERSVTLSGMTVQASRLLPTTDALGGKALCSNVAMTNRSSESKDYNLLDFKFQTPSGAVATTSSITLAGTLDSGTLVSGGVKRGKVCTDNKGERGQYVMIYKPDPFSSARGIWLNKV